MSAIGACSPIIGLCALVALRATHAQRPQPHVKQLDHAAWTVRDGAPSYVNALAQTADGVLWIGSAAGLYRFDGVRFEQLGAPPEDSVAWRSVNELAVMPDSSLWIGFAIGGVAVLTRDHVVNYVARDDIPDGRINGIVRDSSGDTWVSSETGLARLHNGKWRRIGTEDGLPTGAAGRIFVDRRGALWVPLSAGLYVLPRSANRFVRWAVTSDSAEGGIHTPREAPDGSVWGVSFDLGLTRLSDAAGRPVPSRPEVKGIGRGIRSYVDSHGNAWIASVETGLMRVPLRTTADDGLAGARSGQRRAIEKISLLTGPTTNTMLEDRDGNMWIGTGGGLERFRQTALTPVLLPSDLRWPSLAAAPHGRMWLGSYAHSVSLIDDEVAARVGALTGITCVYRDFEGGLWIGAEGRIWYLPPNTPTLAAQFTPIAAPGEGMFGPIVAMARTRNGDLWVSNSAPHSMRGVFRLRGGAWSRAPLPQRFSRRAAFTIIADRADRIWLGYANTVVMVNGDSARVYADSVRLHVGLVNALHESGGNLWIGGQSGLVRMENERFHVISGIPAIRDVTGIVETANGDVWLNGGDGVTRIPASEVARALSDGTYRVRGERFDEHDGLHGAPVQSTPRPTAIPGTDGRLWFTTSVGVAWIDPSNIARNRKAPPVQIRALSGAGKTYDVRRRVFLPARTTQLQVRYTAINLSMPDGLAFRYRLTDVDTSWVEAGSRREAFYTNLKPGSYRFRVIAANEDGVWNEDGASIDFDIPPGLTQTRAFTALVVGSIAAFLIGAGWLLALWRQRQLARALHARFEAQLVERSRVARELHDTLLGDMGGVALQLAAGARRAATGPENDGIVELLSSLRAQVERTTMEARRSVNAMRAAPDGSLPLHQQLANAAQRTFGQTQITVRVEHRGSPRGHSADVALQIIGIATEAMVNARQHAGCETVNVLCTYASREMQILVRDDGRGFEPSRATPAGHWGLVGMRERAASIGATISITSRPGAGTQVTLVIPDEAEPVVWWKRWLRRPAALSSWRIA